MSEEPKKESKFWTFLVQSTFTFGATAYVTGHFVFMRISVEGPVRQTTGIQDVDHDLIYLTPYDSPMTLDVTAFMDTTTVSSMTPDSVVEALQNLLSSYEFMPIPPAPMSIPEGKIPPSMRDKHKEDMKKASSMTVRGPMR